jgi:hypothetical protein
MESLDKLTKTLKNCRTKSEKLDFLCGEIRKIYRTLRSENRTATERAIELGLHLNVLKKTAAMKKREWQAFVKVQFPHIRIRTAQRYMRMARIVGLEKHPALTRVGKVRLEKLSALAKGKPIGELLGDLGVDTSESYSDRSEIQALKRKLDRAFEGKGRAHRGKGRGTLSQLVAKIRKTASSLRKQFRSAAKNERALKKLKSKQIGRTAKSVKKLLGTLRAAKDQRDAHLRN